MGRRLFLPAVLVCCFVASDACGSRYEGIQALKGATVPTGDRVPALEEPLHSDNALQFTWDFDTHLDPRTYLEWVSSQLTVRGFTVQSANSRTLELSRVDGGDAYRVRIDIVSSPPTHVRIGLRASPD